MKEFMGTRKEMVNRKALISEFTILSCICLVISLCPIASADWVELVPGGGQSPAVTASMDINKAGKILDSATIEVLVPGFSESSVELKDGKTYKNISIPGCGITGNYGDPNIPVRILPIRVPIGRQCKVNVEVLSSQNILDIEVAPLQLPPLDGPAIFADPEFKKNDETYSADKYFPVNNLLDFQDVMIRDRRFLMVRVALARYNPVTKTTTFATKMHVKISLGAFLDKVIAPIPKSSSAFDGIGSGVFDMVFADKSDPVTDGGDSLEKYMIILDEQFEANAKLAEFVEWKKRKGYDVILVTTEDIDPSGAPTHNQIRDYLRALPIADYPSYLLIVGDEHQDTGVQGYYFETDSGGYSDLYFACRDDADLYQDLFYGRLPAENTSQLTEMLTHVMDMDRNPPDSSNTMWNKILVSGQIQDSDDLNNIADRLFCETADSIACYFESDPTGTDYTVTRSIVNPSNVTAECQWNSTSILWNSGDIIGSRIFDTFIPAATATTLNSTTINAGAALVQHRDHGWEGGWGDPSYNYTHVYALTNSTRRPVVFSINCLTGRYQYGTNNFMMSLLLNSNGGAHNVFCPVDVSYSWYNDWLAHGFYASMFSDYISNHNASVSPNWPKNLPDPSLFSSGAATRYGQVLNYGLWYLAEKYSDDVVNFRLFHCFGDPEAFVRINPPTSLSVSHSATATAASPTSIDVTVEDGATVCLYSEEADVHEAQVSVGGKASFSFIPSNLGTVHVTVTKYNRHPYEGTITLESALTPFIGISPISLSATYSPPAPVADQSFTVENIGAGTVSYSISDNVAWLSCSPTSGTSTGEKDSITVTYNPAGLSVGVHTGTITVTDAGAGNSPLEIPVSIEISISDPTSFAAVPATFSSIDLSWVKNASSEDVLVAWNSSNSFGTPSATYSIGDPISGGGTVLYKGAESSVSHSGLSSGTKYYYKAWSISAGPNYSSGVTCSGSTLFSVPFSENFEHAGSIPDGWTQEYASGSLSWTFQTGGHGGNPAAAHGGTYNALLYAANYTGPKTKLLTPMISFGTATENTQLTFWHCMANWDGDQDELSVYYKTSSGGAWTLLQTYTSNVTAWTQRTISLPNPNDTYYIAFEGYAKYGYGVCIDDVQITGTTPPEITTSTSSVSISEGSTATFQVKLTAQPSGDKTVAVSKISGDADITVTEGASLGFTTLNWDSYQTVTLAANQDADIVNSSATIRCSSAGMTDRDVTANEIDNDYTLTVNNDGNGTTTPSGASVQTKGGAVSIEATAKPGYIFDIWTVNSGAATFGDEKSANTTATASAATAITANFARTAPEDFNGDSKSDVICENPIENGFIYFMNGQLVSSYDGIYSKFDTDWKVAKIADFNGDGKSDILWEHQSSGQVLLYIMNGSVICSVKTLCSGLSGGIGWRVKDLADFNGDGKADILWEHNYGYGHIALMNGNIVIGGGTVYAKSPNTEIINIADFSGDGKADILWELEDGTGYVFVMNGSAVASEGAIYSRSPQWRIVGYGDFNGDAKTDILWEHSNGTGYIYLMDGAVISSHGYAYKKSDIGWTVKSCADFNGDGKDDLLWEHSAGIGCVYLMNGLGITGYHNIYSLKDINPATRWDIVKILDFNGDGKSDMLWESASTKKTLVYIMNGFAVSATGTVYGNGAGWNLINTKK